MIFFFDQHISIMSISLLQQKRDQASSQVEEWISQLFSCLITGHIRKGGGHHSDSALLIPNNSRGAEALQQRMIWPGDQSPCTVPTLIGLELHIAEEATVCKSNQAYRRGWSQGHRPSDSAKAGSSHRATVSAISSRAQA